MRARLWPPPMPIVSPWGCPIKARPSLCGAGIQANRSTMPLAVGAPVLPANGIVERFACIPAPHSDGLALIGQPHGDTIGIGGGQSRARIDYHALQKIARVLLNPAR